MSRRFDPDQKTSRFRTGELATHATSKVEWARISRTGKVHRITFAIIRWNFKGGTFEKPDITYVCACGPQIHHLEPAIGFQSWEVCARCDNKTSQCA